MLSYNTPKNLRGKATVVDGDGLRMHGHRIRLAGIDAPEAGQPAIDERGNQIDHGEAVRKILEEKIAGRTILAITHETDTYGRLIATVTCGDTDLSHWLLLHGHAVTPINSDYQSVQHRAKKARVGMWAYQRALWPYHWRRGYKIDINSHDTRQQQSQTRNFGFFREVPRPTQEHPAYAQAPTANTYEHHAKPKRSRKKRRKSPSILAEVAFAIFVVITILFIVAAADVAQTNLF